MATLLRDALGWYWLVGVSACVHSEWHFDHPSVTQTDHLPITSADSSAIVVRSGALDMRLVVILASAALVPYRYLPRSTSAEWHLPADSGTGHRQCH